MNADSSIRPRSPNWSLLDTFCIPQIFASADLAADLDYGAVHAD